MMELTGIGSAMTTLLGSEFRVNNSIYFFECEIKAFLWCQPVPAHSALAHF